MGDEAGRPVIASFAAILAAPSWLRVVAVYDPEGSGGPLRQRGNAKTDGYWPWSARQHQFATRKEG
jgi:hypothetical protein